MLRLSGLLAFRGSRIRVGTGKHPSYSERASVFLMLRKVPEGVEGLCGFKGLGVYEDSGKGSVPIRSKR